MPYLKVNASNNPLQGTKDSDILSGDKRDNTLVGLGGNDNISGLGVMTLYRVMVLFLT